MQQHSLLHEITKLPLATSSRNRISSSRAFSTRLGKKTNKQLGLDSNQLPKLQLDFYLLFIFLNGHCIS